ncbi:MULTISPECIES: zinc-ribbon domain-containing protein [Pacificibacter]|uniref:zinc-ribbon domain-containing protein n=1 Tax=Pacificibacter TaxID=1042323 RepID=UPI001C08A46D|nr:MULTISPECIES: zinc-ribbon domain-containing protein [Pacificibacter]MBU2937876.1 zinc-ribbon domain-containing protein [Pacificibacter marinus]MDO6617242.1 zinc-ribbon domain-containing protein [Pacificibacter sp. 1_MG-2023]
MRLICPNCGAQYEVDAKVIPSSGRDVQCSNCGHTWFQRSAEVDSDLAQEMGFELTTDDAATNEPIETMPDDQPAPVAPDFGDDDDAESSDDIVSAISDAAPVESQDDAEEDEAGAPDIAQAVPVQRSAVSESVRDILRAEVAYDQNVRQPQPDALETQTELGLEEAPSPEQKQGLRERMARLRGLNPVDLTKAASGSGKRRDLLPDIEEINSTLSAASDRDVDGTVIDDETRKERARRTSFRTTFLIFIVVVIFLVLLYAFAPILAQKVPALEGLLNAYVTAANAFRAWLDSILSSTSARLNALLGQLNDTA